MSIQVRIPVKHVARLQKIVDQMNASPHVGADNMSRATVVRELLVLGMARMEHLLKEAPRVYRVMLKHHGENKIACIKAIRAITGLGLKESKDLSERCGEVARSSEEDQARDWLHKLIAAGAYAYIEEE